MDVDGAGEIWCAAVIEPVVVGEPAAGFGDEDNVAAARMGDVVFRLVAACEQEVDAMDIAEQPGVMIDIRFVSEVDVRNLVIGNGEGVAGAGVEQFEALFFAYGERAVITQQAVDGDGGIDRFDAVFAEQDHADVAVIEVCKQVADDSIDFGHCAEGWVLWCIGGRARNGGRAEALQVIIKVRQIDQHEGGVMPLMDDLAGLGDPLAGFD